MFRHRAARRYRRRCGAVVRSVRHGRNGGSDASDHPGRGGTRPTDGRRPPPGGPILMATNGKADAGSVAILEDRFLTLPVAHALLGAASRLVSMPAGSINS